MTESPAAGHEVPSYHAVGIGAGPANLSLAALYGSAAPDSAIALFDRQEGPYWHNKLLHSGVRMQTSWLKDLVSMVDPRHELTFLNYLVTTGRMFALLNSQFDFMPRREYVRYLAWAAQKLPNIHYGTSVDKISFDDGFVIHAGGRPVARGEHLVIGMGSAPVVPPNLAGLPDDRAFIADDLTERLPAMVTDPTTPVAVVGGGQTGLEAVLQLVRHGFTDISWLGRRLWFDTIDDSPNANDVYRPAHQAALQRLAAPIRKQVIEGLNLTGDALTPGAMRTLYQANYDGLLDLGHYPVRLYPARNVISAMVDGDDIVLDCQTPARSENYKTRYVIIATGRENVPVPFDDELRQRVEVSEDGDLIVESDFSVRWKGTNGNHMYALNRARFNHGLTDANLTLLPVRAAMVLNSMFQREIYPISDELCPVDWG